MFSLVERQLITDKAHQCLFTNAGEPARKYLMQDRGLGESVLREFHVGYMPDWVSHKLHGRIILPMYDPSGNLVVLNSRSLGEPTDEMPKYWHEHYIKSHFLYGVQQAKEAMRHFGFVVLCEGQIDVLQFHHHGVKNVVGLGSGNLSDVQRSVIYRYCEEIDLLLDRDENQAGHKATTKIIEEEMARGGVGTLGREAPSSCDKYEAKIIPILIPQQYQPYKLDPDSFIMKYGIEEMKRVIRQQRASDGRPYLDEIIVWIRDKWRKERSKWH